jgi:hypothetical protein
MTRPKHLGGLGFRDIDVQFESTCPAVMAAAQRTQLLEHSNSESCLLSSVFNPRGRAWFPPFLDLAEYIGWP